MPGPGALSYFRHPFPPQTGFSPYRFPGILVHLPVWFAITALGLWLNFEPEMLRWATIGWALVGLYVGRDVAIYAHYIPLITLGVVGAMIAGVLVIPRIPPQSLNFQIPGKPYLAVGVDLLLGVLFVWWIRSQQAEE